MKGTIFKRNFIGIQGACVGPQFSKWGISSLSLSRKHGRCDEPAWRKGCLLRTDVISVGAEGKDSSAALELPSCLRPVRFDSVVTASSHRDTRAPAQPFLLHIWGSPPDYHVGHILSWVLQPHPMSLDYDLSLLTWHCVKPPFSNLLQFLLLGKSWQNVFPRPKKRPDFVPRPLLTPTQGPCHLLLHRGGNWLVVSSSAGPPGSGEQMWCSTWGQSMALGLLFWF